MPVIKSAKKKLRKDRKLTKDNDVIRANLRKALKDALKSKTAEKVRKAVVLTDKAVKKNLIHKNKAAHIKSKLSKLAKPVKKTVEKKTIAKKTTPKKKSAKK